MEANLKKTVKAEREMFDRKTSGLLKLGQRAMRSWTSTSAPSKLLVRLMTDKIKKKNGVFHLIFAFVYYANIGKVMMS